MRGLSGINFQRALVRCYPFSNTASFGLCTSIGKAAEEPKSGANVAGQTTQGCTSDVSNQPEYMCVRPGPWKTNQQAYKNLGRVFGQDYEAAKAFNNEVAIGASMVLQEVALVSTSTHRELLAMSFVEQLKKAIGKPGEEVRLTFVNVSTIVHRIGLVVDKTGSQSLMIRYQKIFLQRLAALIYDHLDEFGPRQISNIFWGLGKLGPEIRRIQIKLPIDLPYSPTMDDIVRMLLKKAKIYRTKFLPVNFSNVFLGLAYLDYKRCKRFKAACAPEIKLKLKDFTAQQLSNFSWSLSKLHFTDEVDLIHSMAEAAKAISMDFSARELCGFMQGMVGLEYRQCKSLFDVFLPQISVSMLELSSRELGTLIWVWSRSMYHPGPIILQEAGAQLTKTVQESYGVLARTMLNLAHLNHRDQMLSSMASTFLALDIPLTDYKVQDVCNVLWALAVMSGLSQEHLVNAGKKLRNVLPESLSRTEHHQLYQCCIHIQVFLRDNFTKREEFLSPVMAKRCRDSWEDHIENIEAAPVVSDVSYALQKAGVSLETKMLTEVPLKVNSVCGPSKQVAIEIISSARCFVNNRSGLSGPYLWRERVLKSSGWEIVRIDQHEFQSRPLLTEKVEYLVHELRSQSPALREYLQNYSKKSQFSLPEHRPQKETFEPTQDSPELSLGG